MPSLKNLAGFLVLVFFLGACSGGGKGESGADLKEEVLPKLSKKDFNTVNRSGYEILVHKKMSGDRTSGDVIYSSSFLPREYHMEIHAVPVKRYRKTEGFPQKKQSQLRWFAEKESSKLQQHLMSLEEQPLKAVLRNNKICYTQELHGKEFGFPLQKSYFLRYYRFNDTFVAITCWTVQEHEAEFRKITKYMGMKFAPTK